MRNFAGRLRAWSTAHPWLADAGLAAVMLALAEVSSRASIDLIELSDPSFRTPSFLEEQAGLVAAIAPLALRRRAPLVALLACTAGFVGSRILLHAAEPSVVGIVMSIAIYSAAAYGRTPWRHVACAVSAVAVIGELWREVNENVPPGQPSVEIVNAFFLLFYATLVAAMWALGNAIGAGRRRAAELLERTLALERQREENARRAVFDERVRIARELHDVVAHHVSLMGVQAGAARLVMGRDPAMTEGALSSIEASSRQAVEELHRLLGFLRQAGDSDDLAPRPGVGQVPGLAASMSSSHLTVAVDVEGDERPLPPTVDVSAYRIVQEALTNTLKHAGASRADVRLRYWPGELEVEVVDDGRGPVGAANGPGGLGLIGMRERAAVLGGQLKAGPGRDGGFSVRAKLPTPERS